MSLNISNNFARNDTTEELAKRWKMRDLSFYFLGLTVAASGIIGNASVLIIIKRNRTFQTPQNFLLANLAAADITNLTFCAFSAIPMVTVLPDGVVGTILCEFFVGFNVPITAIVASVFTLTVLAVERYNAVVRPLQMLQLTRKTVRYAIAGTSVASFALSAPLFANKDYKFKEYCKPLYSSETKLTHIIFVAIFLFIIPFIVISFCKIVRTVYNRSTVTPESNIHDKDKLRQRKQLLKMSLTVTAVFVACAGTASITFVLRYFGVVSKAVRGFGLFLLFLSSVINPLIYAFHSLNYCCAFKALLKCE